MMLNVQRNHKAYWGGGGGGGGGGDLNQGPSAYQPNTLQLGQPAHVWRWGKHCHHQNDSCIKMGSDVGHFNVSLIYYEEKGHKKAFTLRQLLKRKES